jgi:hypothetical protein
MKVAEMIYELRSLARNEENFVNKDLFYQSAKTLETLLNVCRMSDHIVSEMERCKQSPECKPCEDENNLESPIKWPISEVPIGMVDEFLTDLVKLGYLAKEQRWPY